MVNSELSKTVPNQNYAQLSIVNCQLSIKKDGLAYAKPSFPIL